MYSTLQSSLFQVNKPTITADPPVAKIGKPITLKCESLLADSFTFYRGDQELQSGADNTYTMEQFTASLAGRYRCVVMCANGDGTYRHPSTDWITLKTAGLNIQIILTHFVYLFCVFVWQVLCALLWGIRLTSDTMILTGNFFNFRDHSPFGLPVSTHILIGKTFRGTT